MCINYFSIWFVAKQITTTITAYIVIYFCIFILRQSWIWKFSFRDVFIMCIFCSFWQKRYLTLFNQSAVYYQLPIVKTKNVMFISSYLHISFLWRKVFFLLKEIKCGSKKRSFVFVFLFLSDLRNWLQITFTCINLNNFHILKAPV